MADIRWIKLAADIFDNRKIRQIEALPDGDAIVVIWIKILCLAGTVNDGGQIYITREIPYTEEMMATQFGRPLNTVRAALRIFEKFGMIQTEDNILRVSNWEKYQSIEGMEKVREQARERMRRMRARKKEYLIDCYVTRDATVTHSYALDIESESEKEKKEKIKENAAPAAAAPPASKTEKPQKHQHGEYKNVLLTDAELAKLSAEYPQDYKERIEALSRYMKSTGKTYKDHLATIRNWARRDGAQKQTQEKDIGTRSESQTDYNAGANAAIYRKLEEKRKREENAT